MYIYSIVAPVPTGATHTFELHRQKMFMRRLYSAIWIFYGWNSICQHQLPPLSLSTLVRHVHQKLLHMEIDFLWCHALLMHASVWQCVCELWSFCCPTILTVVKRIKTKAIRTSPPPHTCHAPPKMLFIYFLIYPQREGERNGRKLSNLYAACVSSHCHYHYAYDAWYKLQWNWYFCAGFYVHY